MASPLSSLPEGFLSGPGPKISIQPIDFAKTALPRYKDLYAVVLDNVLSAEECQTLVSAAEARTNGKWEPAMVNVGNGRQMMDPWTRNCGRIIWDDGELAAKLWERVKASVPEIETLREVPKITGLGPTKRKETWKMRRLNERMRFLKYGKGQYFRPHQDGSFATPDGQEISFCTLHLYLNDSDSSSAEGELEGGSTTFHSYDMRDRFDVEPKVGRVLIFQHRDLLHSGDDVTSGIKMTVRTDMMYKKVDEEGAWIEK